jgi:hypothetical protein
VRLRRFARSSIFAALGAALLTCSVGCDSCDDAIRRAVRQKLEDADRQAAAISTEKPIDTDLVRVESGSIRAGSYELRGVLGEAEVHEGRIGIVFGDGDDAYVLGPMTPAEFRSARALTPGTLGLPECATAGLRSLWDDFESTPYEQLTHILQAMPSRMSNEREALCVLLKGINTSNQRGWATLEAPSGRTVLHLGTRGGGSERFEAYAEICHPDRSLTLLRVRSVTAEAAQRRLISLCMGLTRLPPPDH